MKDKLYSLRHIIFLVFFLIIHGLTCIFTTYFGDDYYYAAFLRNGAEYMLSENIFHYMYTNGRALVHIIDEILLGIDFNLWRISTVLVMGAASVLVAKLASRQYRQNPDKEQYKNALIVTLSFISVTDIAILRQSVYWATGALNYLYPATLTLLYVYLARRAYCRERGFFPLIPLALIASATTEQASAALLLATLWLFVTAVIEKKRKLVFPILTNILVSAAGISTLLFSPGSAARTEYYPDFYAMNIPERILRNFSELIKVIFGGDGIYALVSAAIILVIFHSYKKLPLLSVLSAVSLGAYVYGFTVKSEMFDNKLFLLIIAIPIASVMVYTLVDYFKNREADNLYFVWGAVAMQCIMAISPEFGPRTLTISLFLLIVPIVRGVVEARSLILYSVLAGLALVTLPYDLSNFTLLILLLAVAAVGSYFMSKKWSFPLIPTAAALCTLAIFATVPAGYSENLSTLNLNRAQIEEYSPSSGEPLTLYYLPNSTYKYTMPYDDSYHQRMLMRLCGLPEDTEVIYIWK